MAKQLTKEEWRQRRKKYKRVTAELTLAEIAEWRELLESLDEKPATRLRKLIADDILNWRRPEKSN
jgi:hypothetical protein